MSNDYSFCDAVFAQRFIDFVATHGLTGQLRADLVAGVLVQLPDDLPDDLQETIEDHYDTLMDEQQALIEAEEGAALLGVDVTLPDGSPCKVSLPADLGRRLVEHFSPAEIHRLVQGIANNVAEPSLTPLCCRPG